MTDRDEGRLHGWIIGIGFDDETEEYVEAEFTERPPPEEELWMKATLIKGEHVRAPTSDRDEGRTETPVVGLDQLHRYLADAFMRGADKEYSGEVPREYELRIAEAEAWAREFIGLRTENGLIRAEPSGDEVRIRELREYLRQADGPRQREGMEAARRELEALTGGPVDLLGEPSGDVGEEEMVAKIIHDACESVSPGEPIGWEDRTDDEREYCREHARRILARLRRTPETEALREISRGGLGQYGPSQLEVETRGYDFRSWEDGFAVACRIAKHIADRALATQDPNAGGEDE